LNGLMIASIFFMLSTASPRWAQKIA